MEGQIVEQAFVMSDLAWKAISIAFIMGIAVMYGTKAQGFAAKSALEGIARNPSAKDKIQTPMILGLALIESLVIFALVVSFVLMTTKG